MLGRVVQLIERPFVFFPQKTLKGTPEHLGLAYRDVEFQSGDGTPLHGWWIPGPASQSARLSVSAERASVPSGGADEHSEERRHTTVLFFHGNGGNISARLDNLLDIHRRMNADILAFDYRGYGRSGGVPTEQGIYRDARAAGRTLRESLLAKTGSIIYYGRSMGAAIASHLAREYPPAALILECPPPSVPSVAHLQVKALKFAPLRWLMRTRFETEKHVRGVRCPVLVIQAECDSVVPAEYGRRVYDAAPGPKQWLLVPNAGHDRVDLSDSDAYYGAINNFLSKYAA